jgi:hypothetical protein
MLLQRPFARGFTGHLIIFALCGTLMAATCLGQDRAPQDAAAGGVLKAFLQNYPKSGSSEFDKTTRYSAAFADLSGAKVPEVVVYVSGRAWCGSGSCSMPILRPDGVSLTVIARTTITRPPIRVLQTTTNGWHDVGVWVQGGEILAGYTAVLSFNGKAYASNPTVPPARQLAGDSDGEILIPKSAEGFLLYP